ncbi:hypothetical protein BT69DRAFT_1220033, partial [Atractiella rhizophila]
LQSRVELLNTSSLRSDNRRPFELRHINYTLAPIPPSISSANFCPLPPGNPTGYGEIGHGLTKVQSSLLCSLQVQAWCYGPWEVPEREEGGVRRVRGDKAEVRFEVGVVGWGSTGGLGAGAGRRGDRPLRQRRIADLCNTLKQTFEPVILTHLYPRSEIDIFLLVAQHDGSLLQACINAATLSLLSAGISLTDYIVSLSLCSLTPPNPSKSNATFTLSTGVIPLLDPTALEETTLPTLTLALLPFSSSPPKIALINLEARLPIEILEELSDVAVKGAIVIAEQMREKVKEWGTGVARRAGLLKTGLTEDEEMEGVEEL